MSISIPKEKFFFTSESVTEGHPDKVADQISDAILDAIMAEDKRCRVACETLVTTGMAFIAGEITTQTYVEMPQIVRDTIRDIGYNSSKMGFDWQTCAVMTSIDHQSLDIAQGVDKGDGLYKEQGAGDQGFAGHPAALVFRHDGIEDGVGNLVGHLVRMPLGHGLGGEKELFLGYADAHVWVSLNLPPTFGDGAANRPHGWAEIIFSIFLI
jgi:hypothetical protein